MIAIINIPTLVKDKNPKIYKAVTRAIIYL